MSAAGLGRVGIGAVTGGGMGERGEEECGQGNSFPCFVPVQYMGFSLRASVVELINNHRKPQMYPCSEFVTKYRAAEGMERLALESD